MPRIKFTHLATNVAHHLAFYLQFQYLLMLQLR